MDKTVKEGIAFYPWMIGLIYALGDVQGHISHGAIWDHRVVSFILSWMFVSIVAEMFRR